MNNQQQSNFYGNQQHQYSDQWNNLSQWQNWQQQFQQSSYQQSYMYPQAFDQASQFAAPPPPPPENSEQQPQPPAPPSAPGRNSGQGTISNFNQNNNSNNNRGQSSRGGNWRGNQRGRGNNRNDKKQFNNPQNQHNSGNADSSFQSNSNYNESSSSRQGNFAGNSNRGKNQRNNWRNNRNSSGQQQQQEISSNAPSNPLLVASVPFYQQNIAPASLPVEELQTPEDIAFEEEFRKWETQFQEWKNQNKNHPDKRQYQMYEKQFMDVREKLLTRREEMRRKKLQNASVVNPVKTAEQIAFETQWNNAPKVQNENSNKSSTPIEPPTIFDPLASASQLPPPETSQSSVSAAAILFGGQISTRNYNSFEKDDDFDDFESFEDSRSSAHKAFDDMKRNLPIPGLEFDPSVDEPQEKEADDPDVIDLEREEEQETVSEPMQREEESNSSGFTNPPFAKEDKPEISNSFPRFRPRVQRNVISIDDLLCEPLRSTRPEKIMIIIRGAPGSGKHFLANLIYEKEREMDNDRCRILSVSRFITGRYDYTQTDNYNQALYAECRNLVREGFINFAIVILNGCTIQQFQRISHAAMTLGGYHCYSIEIHQRREFCEAHNVNKRNAMDIINAIEDLDRYPTPFKINVIDPSSLLKSRGNTNNATSSSSASGSSNVNDFAQKMANILQDKKVMEILQAQLSNPTKPQSTTQLEHSVPHSFQKEEYNSRFYQAPATPINVDVPVFKPAKIIDYNHEHKPSLEETLMEFKIFRVTDYNHKEMPSMREYLKDVDLDKIVEKRKAVALRKKILEYLRSAERPEDTVSNPKYPKNWEVIQEDRPPRRNKRKKIKTAKIKRILLHKSREENSWMTRGYNHQPASGQNDAMDFEEISSDDDDENVDPEDKTPNKVQIMETVPLTKSQYQDEFEKMFKTTPDFNHFNHPNVMDIRKLLALPERRKRPSKILIILRGPSGSGKSHLVQLIKRKENEMGSEASDIRILCIDDYFLPEDDEEQSSDAQDELIKSYLEEMQKHLKKTINEGLHHFIIIDANNCDLSAYTQFHQIGSSMNFTVYTVELFQTLEICSKQCKRQRSTSDIKNSIDLLTKNRTPNDHTLLIPTALYAQYECFVNPAVSTVPSSITPFRKYLEQTIDERLLTSMPNFNWHNREIMNIGEILGDPGRFQRSENIAILLRGPCGSGKEELASAIIDKEQHYGNENAKFISISEEGRAVGKAAIRFDNSERSRDDKLEKLLKSLRDIMRAKAHKFLVIDAETGQFSNYKQVHELVTSYQYQCYTIELYREASVCMESEPDPSARDEIENVLEEMQLNPTPDDHVLLNAAMFYKPTTNSTDRPLKSALKVSPNTSLNVTSTDHLQESYTKAFSRLDIEAKFSAIFNQRTMIDGDFVKRNDQAPSKLPEFNWFNQDITEIREILDEPSRSSRPQRIVIFLRGAPGSGKTFLARLIARREFERGNEKCFQLLSVDEFFETEQYREVGSRCEKYIKVTVDASKVGEYMERLREKFQSQITAASASQFIVVDGIFCNLKYYNEMWSAAKENNFACYTIELNQDDDICLKYNDHKWSDALVRESNRMMQTFQTPTSHSLLDPEALFHDYVYELDQRGSLLRVDEAMDTSDVSDTEDFANAGGENNDDEEEDASFETKFGKFKMSAVASKWDDVETPDINRLDGTMKKSERVTMKDYLQSDEWSMRPSTSGKKRVRWADIEEKKAQERMRSIGFIVGMTDWNRMTDESDGRSALEKTKYIEPRKKN